jgi:lycopene cyclase domain-containing protein
MSYTYLLVNFFSIIIPLIFSFHKKLLFHKKWIFLWPAIGISGILFILWDILYTKWGVWGFNPDYLIKITIYNLPIEEILFFICIPYSCVFTYHCFDILFKNNSLKKHEPLITYTLIFSLLIVGIFNFKQIYTSVTFIGLALFISFCYWYLKVPWLSNFYRAYAILLIPFLIVNGILTGTGIESPIVWYNDLENMRIRLGTIPIEDVFYGMFLILLNVFFFEYFSKKHNSEWTIR